MRNAWLRITTTLIPAAVLLAMAAPPAAAQDLIHACYVPNSGTIYRVMTDDTKAECAPKHVEFQWNEQGPQGMSGWERVSTDCTTVPPGGTSGSAVSCPAGKNVLGGGPVFYTDNTCSEPHLSLATSARFVTHSGPASDTQWSVGVFNGTQITVFVRFHAICATVN